jgi:hypothetical protein
VKLKGIPKEMKCNGKKRSYFRRDGCHRFLSRIPFDRLNSSRFAARRRTAAVLCAHAVLRTAIEKAEAEPSSAVPIEADGKVAKHQNARSGTCRRSGKLLLPPAEGRTRIGFPARASHINQFSRFPEKAQDRIYLSKARRVILANTISEHSVLRDL